MLKAKPHTANILISKLKYFLRSSYFFPVILLVPLVIFTALGINGSSIGTMHKILYANALSDDTLVNEPRSIRSDEWLVNTQQAIAQSKIGYPEVNPNIGNGQNMSINDVPYRDWSSIFKPHNLGFLIMPLEQGFAFKWWIMAYLLIVSCYFFILTLLRDKRMIATLLSLALFFSAFVQWWYAYGTMGSLYYSFFIMGLVILFLRQKKLKQRILLSIPLAYTMACFGLVLYPPFQIACALVVFFFLIGYLVNQLKNHQVKNLRSGFAILTISLIFAIGVIGMFIATRSEVVDTINSTAYPGKRVMNSGEFFPRHFFSAHLGQQFNIQAFVPKYLINDKDPSNESETSNFLFVAHFLIIPAIMLLLYQKQTRKKIDYSLLVLVVLQLIFLAHLFFDSFSPFARLIALDKVGGARLLIGLGLLNVIMLIVFIKNLHELKNFKYGKWFSYGYLLIVFGFLLALALYAEHNFPGFIGTPEAIVVSIPLALSVFLLINRRFTLALTVYLLFSIYISAQVNPLQKGLDVVTENPLSKSIQRIGVTSNDIWVSDGGYLEHVVIMNGERSLSGVHNYPQFSLWQDIDSQNSFIYNRYAHVGFQISSDPQQKTELTLLSPDSFIVKTYACGEYLKKQNVRYILTPTVLNTPCLTKIDSLSFPAATIYIYERT